MNGRTHLLVSSGLGYMLYPQIGLAGACATAIGGLLPDIDHPKSMLGKYVPMGAVIGRKHRGWLHTLVGAMVFTVPLMFYSVDISIGLLIGYLSHLLLDSLNPTGIMWLWPVSNKRIHFMKIRTGSLGEMIFISLVALLFILKVWYS